MKFTIPTIPKVEFIPLRELHETREAGVVMTQSAWDTAQPFLALKPVWQANVIEASLPAWNELLESFRGEVVYSVGGGLAVDAAKWIASQKRLPLVSIPTALSVDAFLTSTSGVRGSGCVRYIETKPPDLLLVDLVFLSGAPSEIRAAGICDVLSITTGSWDWRFAETYGQNPPGMAYDPAADRLAHAILESAYDCAQAAGRGDPQGLKALLDCLLMEVVLCNTLGHSRPEEGSEHYFAYAVENRLEKGFSHGSLVGPGILQVAALQEQKTDRLKKALHDCRVPLDTIPPIIIEEVMRSLPAYARRHNLPFGIAHTLIEGQFVRPMKDDRS